ncbi:MAG: cation:proton antiporter [Tannerella sp.]|jgi:Kef-type K+ transport system membrane component KefB|nr:cation:proton antiporter [Tannerella sp.]
MKKEKKNSLVFYTLMILVFGALMWFVIQKGAHLRGADQSAAHVGNTQEGAVDGFRFFVDMLLAHVRAPFGLLLLQIIVILITARIVGWIFNRMRQPSVIGEILAGIILGPSILGYFMPEVSLFLFPQESLSSINMLSQFGLMLFMYTIGMELDLGEVKKKLQTSILISHTSLIVPFFLGVLMAYFIYDTYAGRETSFLSFALFIGIAMSITAFPVLARIIQEKKLTRTHLGTIALASAANGDISAWCILAVVMAVTQMGSVLGAIYNIMLSVAYMLVMFFIVRPLLRLMGDLYHNREVVSKPLIMLMFLLLLLSSYMTEILGLHALFGAFMVGIVMPENLRFRTIMTEKVEDVSLALFLPLFFASTGLRTEIGLLNTTAMWQLCGLFIVVAVVGKFGSTVISARVAKESWKDSLLLGGLMNTRGLMELIVLTIGYEMQILPPPVFVMLVLMTLVTTFMTTPLLSFINFCFRAKDKFVRYRKVEQEKHVFKVLLSFGRAGNGQIMLDVAHQMFAKGRRRFDLTALHLTVGSDVNPAHTGSFERISFAPILYEARKLNMHIQTRYEVSASAEEHIVKMVNDGEYDFLLVGAGIAMSNLSNDVDALHIQRTFTGFFRRLSAPPFLFTPGALIKDKTKWFIKHTRCSVGIFVNRGFIRATRIIIIINSADDLVLLDYARTLAKSTGGAISVLNRSSFIASGSEHIHRTLVEFAGSMEEVVILPEKDVVSESFNGHDFMLVGYATWNILSVECEEALMDMPSTLIIHHRKGKEGS